MRIQKLKTSTPSVLIVSGYRSSLFLLILASFLFQNCASKKPINDFSHYKTPSAPDYANLNHWAAHPDRQDPADRTPKGTDLRNEQANAEVDVFFLHPTSLLNGRKNEVWNGDVNDTQLNKKTDDGSILYQTSIFNGSARIFAPRYRQAHIYSFYTDDKASAKKSLELAYSDIKTAFEHYLKHWNNGRPIIIAAHSQGALHTTTLLKEFFDGQNLKNRLVAAYIVGWPVRKDAFQTIPVCESPEQTGCFCSWRTYKKGYEPRAGLLGDMIAVVNPLSWTTDKKEVDKSLHQGCVLIGFQASGAKTLGTQINNGILWVDKPQFKGSFLYRTPNYHVGDYNLFYLNVREDVKRRIGLFWKR